MTKEWQYHFWELKKLLELLFIHDYWLPHMIGANTITWPNLLAIGSKTVRQPEFE